MSNFSAPSFIYLPNDVKEVAPDIPDVFFEMSAFNQFALYPTNNPVETVNSNSTEIFQPDKTNYIGEGKPIYLIVLFVIITLTIVVINLRVICIVTDVPRRKLRPANLLVVHLSSVAIGFSFILGMYVVENLGIIGNAGATSCKVLSFFRNVLYAVHPLNIIVVIYERILTFRESPGELLVKRAILLFWVVAAIESVPGIFMVKYEKDPLTRMGKCKQAPLMGSYVATMIHGLLRFLLVHVFTVGYMCFALFQIRSKIKFLYIMKPIPNRRILGTVRRLRFVYFYSLLFILVWLPTGFIVLAYTLLGRTGKDYSVIQGYLLAMFIINYTYLIISPVLFVCMNEDVSKNDWCSCSWFGKRRFSSGRDIPKGETLPVEADEGNAV